MKIAVIIVLLSIVAGQVQGQLNVDSVMKADSSLKAALKKRNLTLEGSATSFKVSSASLGYNLSVTLWLTVGLKAKLR